MSLTGCCGGKGAQPWTWGLLRYGKWIIVLLKVMTVFMSQSRLTAALLLRCVNSHSQKQEGWYNMRRQWRRDLIASLKLPYCLLKYFICGRIFWVYCNCRDWCNAQAKTVIYYCFEIAFQSTLVANKCLKYQLENDVVEKGFKQLKINTNMIWKNFVFKHVLLFVGNVSQWWNHCVYDKCKCAVCGCKY